MISALRQAGLALAGWLAMGAAVAPPPATDDAPAETTAPPPEPEPTTPEPEAPPPAKPTPVAATGADALGPAPAGVASAIDGVLPCGVRVIVAEDRSLPVAAVVLAVETGTEDDPHDQPGLVRALAYHLLQGNREDAPGGAAAMVHDAGGFTTLAIGPAQVRYENLVPISRLGRVLAAEANRLRAPTVTAELWTDTLRWARRDPPRRWASHPDAVASAHRVPSLAQPGTVDLTVLTGLSTSAVANALAERFTYTRATLTIVAPRAPEQTWSEVMEAFADLPPAVRATVDRTTAIPNDRATPRSVPIDPASGELFLWPIPPRPAAIQRASVWCKALNRQQRIDPESKRARVRCHLDEDPRRSTLTVRASGDEAPLELLTGRLQRLRSGGEAALVDDQRREVRADQRMELRMPLPLARRLAQAGPQPRGAAAAWRPLDDVTGLDVLADDAAIVDDAVFDLAAAIQLVPAQGSTAQPDREGPTP